MQKLTKEQAIVITGFTGRLACKFSDFHSDVEKRIGHPVFIHEFADEEFKNEIEEMYREDFLSMIGD